ncbi:hypothetical protein TKK_0009344 [Trichogramma kaykai]|uniref:protein-tyrosine-phosphatase n=1 Tax=Trichogramma kaykai TaxID=54128 RepID=A0ABD2X214_9HYME
MTNNDGVGNVNAPLNNLPSVKSSVAGSNSNNSIGSSGANNDPLNKSSSNVETEFLEINQKNGWPALLRYISNECSNYEYTADESKKFANRTLNRYRDVSPYDHSRIILQKGSVDYINGNLLKIERANRQYILTQGPLPNTAGHFWQMVWEQNSKVIIMLNKVIENSLTKCHQYWPLDKSEGNTGTMVFKDEGFKVELIKRIGRSHFVKSTLRLTNTETSESRDIYHFHYTTWPDFGVPGSPTAFLQFLAEIRETGTLEPTEGPAIVHCSAGIGRSGTFCLVDTCLVLIEKNGLNSVNVREVLLEMRRSRMGLIQTPDQLRFSYIAIIEGSKNFPVISKNSNEEEDETNNCDSMNNINNTSIEEEDEPPLPPPRGESLTRSKTTDNSPSPSSENDNTSSSSPLSRLLPRAPENVVNSNSTSNHVSDHNSSDSTAESLSNDDSSNPANSSPTGSDINNDLRRRRMEKKERLDAQVRGMKRRQKESEDWQQLKRSLFSPISLGVGAAIVGGGVLAFYTLYYGRG